MAGRRGGPGCAARPAARGSRRGRGRRSPRGGPHGREGSRRPRVRAVGGLRRLARAGRAAAFPRRRLRAAGDHHRGGPRPAGLHRERDGGAGGGWRRRRSPRRPGGPAMPASSGSCHRSAYDDDPLRPLRLVRLAAELDLEPEPDTRRLTAEAAAAPLRARSGAHLRRASPPRGLRRRAARPRAGQPAGRARRRAARAHGTGGHRAEPLPPSRRAGPHPRGAAAADGDRVRPRGRSSASWRRRWPRCWTSRWPTSSTRGECAAPGRAVSRRGQAGHARRARRRKGHVRRARQGGGGHRREGVPAAAHQRAPAVVRGPAHARAPAARLPRARAAAAAACDPRLPAPVPAGGGRGHGALVRGPDGNGGAGPGGVDRERTWSWPAR